MPDQTVDVDEARTVGVAVPPASKDEYLEASNQLQPGFVATVDATDPSIGWTSQHMVGDREMGDGEEAEVRGFVEPGDNLPGQVYLPSQLPDPQAAIQAGLAPVKIPEHLITEDENHIQGLEMSERLGLGIRDELREAVVRHRKGVAEEESDAGVVNRNSGPASEKRAGSDGGTTPAKPQAPQGGDNKQSDSAPASTS